MVLVAYGVAFTIVHVHDARRPATEWQVSRFLSVEAQDEGRRGGGTRANHMRLRSGGLYPPVSQTSRLLK